MNDLPTRRAFARAGAAGLERQVDQALEGLAAERAAQHAVAKALGDRGRALEGTVTRDIVLLALEGGDPRHVLGDIQVRDASGWHPVLRVNRTTVTVPGPWGGTRKVRIDRIREVR